jgi:hypothetical protein
VANSPIPDLHAYLVGFVGREIAANPPPLTLEEVDQVPDQELPPGLKLNLKASMRRFGRDTVAGWLERTRDFRIGDALQNIRCPSLALVGEGEGPAAMDLDESLRGNDTGAGFDVGDQRTHGKESRRNRDADPAGLFVTGDDRPRHFTASPTDWLTMQSDVNPRASECSELARGNPHVALLLGRKVSVPDAKCRLCCKSH